MHLLLYAVVDCCRLDDPIRGQVEFSKTTVGSTANYTCIQGYIPSDGSSIRTCEANGEWSGSPPSCEGQNMSPYKSTIERDGCFIRPAARVLRRGYIDI